MEVDNGYVARAGAVPTTAEQVHRAGVKIAVAQGSAPNTILTRLIRTSEIIQVPGGFEPARKALAVYGETCISPISSLTPCLQHLCCGTL